MDIKLPGHPNMSEIKQELFVKSRCLYLPGVTLKPLKFGFVSNAPLGLPVPTWL